MNPVSALALILSFTLPLFCGEAEASEKKTPTALLVDKKTNLLYVTETVGGTYKVLKTFHATLGKVKGDKEDEGDLKTPEGVYTFKAKLFPPSLKPKFGKLAFYVNYPNAYDDIAGHTGFDIMLHATNEPDRLKQNYDSEGCVVVKNEEIEEISPFIRLGLTPILIFQELSQDVKNEYWNPGAHEPLKQFFTSWIKAWENKEIDAYADHYHSAFTGKGMDLPAWKKYKASLNQAYETIQVGPEDILYYRHPKYSVVTFTQNYRSKFKNGSWGHKSRGTKILYIGEESGKPKIIAETYTELMW
jgi:murein L,D-transpeptidase YafK